MSKLEFVWRFLVVKYLIGNGVAGATPSVSIVSGKAARAVTLAPNRARCHLTQYEHHENPVPAFLLVCASVTNLCRRNIILYSPLK